MASPFAKLLAFCREIRASTSIIMGLAALALCGAAAVSVDGSTFYVKKRRLQSAVDLAALAAVANSGAARAAASTSLTANGISPASLAVTTGSFDSTRPLGARFVAGASPANAAQVRATISTPMILGRIIAFADGTSTVTVGATGQAAAIPIAAFGLGSRLAGLNGGVANSVLSSLLGAQVALTAVDYEALANASIDMGAYLNALAVAVGAGNGTYADLLGSRVPLSKALAAIASSGVDSRTGAAIATLLNALSATNGTVSLGGIVDLGTANTLTIGSKLPVQVSMNGYDLVSDLAQMAAGNQQTTIDLSGAAPGLAGASLTLTLGAATPTTRVAPYATTTTAATRQTQVALVTSTNVAGLGTVRLPLALTLAKATATTQGPTCSGGAPTLQLSVVPSAAELSIGSGPINAPPIATILGIRIDGSASASIGTATPTLETFVRADVQAGTVKTVSSTSPTASLVASALGNLTFSVYGVGVPVALPGPTLAALGTALSGLAGPTDTLLDSVLRTLGVGVGQADTWVTDLRCGNPALVQ